MQFRLAISGRSERQMAATMGVAGGLSPQKIKRYAQRVFRFLFPRPWTGEVFLCGGAFKPLLKPGLKVNNLDLWVRDRREREKLFAHLIARGARLVRDFHPYCIRLELDGYAVEITYHNIHSGRISEIVHGFDIAGCSIGAQYKDGEVCDVYVSPKAIESTATSKVLLEDGYVHALTKKRVPTALRGIDRLQRFAAETGYAVCNEDLEELWTIFHEVYSPEEKQQAIDLYLETSVGFKEISDTNLLRRAGFVTV